MRLRLFVGAGVRRMPDGSLSATFSPRPGSLTPAWIHSMPASSMPY